MATDLTARRGFPRAQDHGHRASSGGVVDMDRQKAALIIMRIEQRQLLMTVHDIDRVVDIERHPLGRRPVALQPEIDQHIGKPDDGSQVWQVFGPRQCRLRAQVQSAVGQPPAGELEGWIVTQPVEIIGVLVATGDRENPRPHYIGQAVLDPGWIARIKDHRGKLVGKLQAAFGCGQQHDATIRSDPTTVECRCDFLACNGWK